MADGTSQIARELIKLGAIWARALPRYFDKWGVRYVLVDGWATRARSSGGFDNMMGVGIHHTASHTTVQRDLAWQLYNSSTRPIGNGLLARDGVFHFGAAGASNTQGKGGPRHTSRGVIGLDNGNRNTFSIEAANNGVGEPWPLAQQLAYPRLVAAVIDWANNETPGPDLGPGDVWAHFEWTDRKVDPAGQSKYASGGSKWNMHAFRADVLHLLAGSPTPTPVPQPPPPVPPSSSAWVNVNIGENGTRVVEVQYALTSHGFAPYGGPDGSYGLHTAAAVENFQRSRGLPVYGSTVDAATAAALGFNVGSVVPAPAPPPPPPATAAVPAPTLRLGSSGDQVRWLIDILKFARWYPAAYLGDTNNGSFGSRTDTGVRTMQRAIGVLADGVYGPVTAGALSRHIQASS